MRFFNIIQGMFVRLLFTVSSIIAVWRVVSATGYDIYWLLLFFNVILYVEAIVTFTQRKSGEWKWFCPSVFIYLLMAVPCTWVLEITLLNERIAHSPEHGKKICAGSDEIFTNASALSDVSIRGLEVNIPLYLTEHMWSLAMQQILLFVLIIGRWLLPKGDLTRDQLSQLLLVYIGIAADILEFSTEGLKMEETRCNILMCIWILGIWTWSLLQFTLGLTVTKARKPRVASSRDMEPRMQIMCCETEVWGIMATVVMQDGPFLALRLYVLVELNAINQMMIFFTCKNTLVVLLQFYRLLVVFIEKPGHDPHSIMGRIQRYRHPGMRFHSGSDPRRRGMPSERDASTNKLLSLDAEASTPGHLMPLLPTDNLTLDGRLRHSVNMARPEELFSHTPQLPERFPHDDTAFVLGKTLPNDIPVIPIPDEIGVCDSPEHSFSDYDNLHTPYGSVPNENGDIERHVMIPDIPELDSVYGSEGEAERNATEGKNVENALEVKEDNEHVNDDKNKKKSDKKKGKKKKDDKKKEDKKKEEKKKSSKKKEDKKKDDKKKDDKKKDDKKKDDKKKDDKKKDDKKKDDQKENQSRQDQNKDEQNKDDQDINDQNKVDYNKDDDKNTKDQSIKDDDKKEDVQPISTPASPPKSPPKSPVLVSFADL